MKVKLVLVPFILIGRGRTWYKLYFMWFVKGKRITYTRNLFLMNTSKSIIFTIKLWYVALNGIGNESSLGMSAWLAFICFTIWAGVIMCGCNIPFWEFMIASIRMLYSFLHSPNALSNCILCSLTVSSMEVPVNISLISPSRSFMCLAISSKPLDNILSFSDTASRVEFIDLKVDFTTVICSFESLKKSICSFSKLEIFSP